ncbi:polyphosphate kinase 2 [Campylobacter gracilis]|uniref:ADP/GDP-polyphosphate phosphotransferase n=1 Tax=Campylobacter gracilis RM3268 TaxID=553220 RepID=C8PE18_9BACT|nr:polyphosphate kinase 2 [Campylobacter gracilis]AKT92765.1 polyphosphate kinase 2 [Campylobacter gracilis]EEV18891.1 polyphosphate kinase 2 [Campylobacter gracilis RM3268]UEB45061.1 polyphosphate kinase 2 [Campylobacter gracilis]SUW82281.1 PvdS [Campylobacter gracilis]
MSKEIKTETGEIALKEIEFKSSKYEKISFKDYETLLERYQIELLKLQKFVKEKGLKILILMEGRDAAGKGGTIKRLTEHLNPRGCRIVALEKPSNVEKTQWYFQRYVAHLPSGGEIAIFDRSWYNRAMVEPVMGFCTHAEHKDFLRQVPKFEELLVSAGIILFKFYFSVSKEEQKRRFESRRTDPLKQYKLSPVDARSQELWNQYTLAKYSMLLASNTEFAPWTILDSNDKKIARLNAFRCILSRIDYPEKIGAKELAVDPNLVRNGAREIVLMEDSQKSEAWRKLESPSRKNKKDKKKG